MSDQTEVLYETDRCRMVRQFSDFGWIDYIEWCPGCEPAPTDDEGVA